MHVRELVELGAFVATNCRHFSDWTDPLVERHIEQYWLAARCRQNRWYLALHGFRTSLETSDHNESWQDLQPVIHEILASELLTRTWTAVTSTPASSDQPSQWEPIARSVFIGHVEASSRALNAIVYGCGIRDEDGKKINQLRHRVERWTDLLLARIMLFRDVSELGFDPDRVREFAADFMAELGDPDCEFAWQLTLDSFRASFEQALNLPCPNADLNRQMGAGILASFPVEQFEETRLLDGKWMLRLEHTTQDMENLICEFDRIGRPTLRSGTVHCDSGVGR